MNDCSVDSIISIISFLAPSDLAQFLVTSKKLTTLLRNELPFIWTAHFSRRWNLESSLTLNLLRNQLCTDRNIRDLYPKCAPLINNIICENSDVKCQQETLTAIFVGTVGDGNRSIQSAQSFPRLRYTKPRIETTSVVDMKSMLMRMQYFSQMVYQTLCFPNRTKTVSDSNIPKKEENIESDVAHQRQSHINFSTPYLSSSTITISTQYHIQPRHVAYYEVEILPLREVNNQVHIEEFNDHTTIAAGGGGFVGSECVAVGLGSKYFQRHKRLPGWDGQSYGYHSDDGAIFHGRGRQLKQYGPIFGMNDTIGCGINYQDSSIFFTLNGRHLGTAFAAVPLGELELYPTVGIDCNCSARFNFGKRHFKFNLAQYAQSVQAQSKT